MELDQRVWVQENVATQDNMEQQLHTHRKQLIS